MENQIEYTATLKDFFIETWELPKGETCKVARGYIFGDTRKRFADGEYIRTSRIVEETDDAIITLNSTYKKG